MQQVKYFEVRDKATFIPVMAVRIVDGSQLEINERESYLLRRAGYQGNNISCFLCRLDDGVGKAGSYEWNDRTMTVAHAQIEEKWKYLSTGEVIDVEFILKETYAPKLSERWAAFETGEETMAEVWKSQSKNVLLSWLKAIQDGANEKLTAREDTFLDSIFEQLSTRDKLSQIQQESLERIYARYTS